MRSKTHKKSKPVLLNQVLVVLATVLVLSALLIWVQNCQSAVTKSETKEFATQAIITKTADWKNPICKKVREGRSEWDCLIRAGWPENKITWPIVEIVQKSKLNYKVYASGRCLRTGDNLWVPAYKPHLKNN